LPCFVSFVVVNNLFAKLEVVKPIASYLVF